MPGETGAISSETGETGDTILAETGESDDDGGRTTGGSRPSDEVECLVSVTDLPASLLAGGDTAVGAGGEQSCRRAGADLVGKPRSARRFLPDRQLDPEDCRGGAVPLQAPEGSQSRSASDPADKLIVSCAV
jgi:hypothetical protein